MAMGQRWYCPVCHAKYNIVNGVLVEFMHEGVTSNVKSPFPDKSWQDIKAMAVERAHMKCGPRWSCSARSRRPTPTAASGSSRPPPRAPTPTTHTYSRASPCWIGPSCTTWREVAALRVRVPVCADSFLDGRTAGHTPRSVYLESPYRPPRGSHAGCSRATPGARDVVAAAGMNKRCRLHLQAFRVRHDRGEA